MAADEDGDGDMAMSEFTSSQQLVSQISDEEFERDHWPKLERSIHMILEKSPNETVQLSFEELYRTVYKCVCYHHSEKMYTRLTNIFANHLDTIPIELKDCSATLYLENFQSLLVQVQQGLSGICAVFNYMNCVYNAKVGYKNLRSHLVDMFCDVIRSKTDILRVLSSVASQPFAVNPEVLASIIKGLYSLNPEFAKEDPALYARYIPNVLPQSNVEELPYLIEEESRMQEDLVKLHGFKRLTGSKRKHEDLSDDETILCDTDGWR